MQYDYDHFERQTLLDDMRFHTGPEPGEPLPNVRVYRLDGGPMRLRDLHPGRPLLLTFGSITCPMTQDAMPLLRSLHQEYGEKVTFATLYVREAHPGERFPQPHSFDQKVAHARAMRRRDLVHWPILVDDIDGTLHRLLDPKPNAAYLVGPDGQVLSRMLWTNHPRPLRKALRAVVHEGPHVLGERRSRLVPMMRGAARARQVLAAAGPSAQRDLIRQAPPLYGVAWVADRIRRRPVATAAVVAAAAATVGGAWLLTRKRRS